MATFNVQLNTRGGSDGRHLLMIHDPDHSEPQAYLPIIGNDKAKFGNWIRTSPVSSKYHFPAWSLKP